MAARIANCSRRAWKSSHAARVFGDAETNLPGRIRLPIRGGDRRISRYTRWPDPHRRIGMSLSRLATVIVAEFQAAFPAA